MASGPGKAAITAVIAPRQPSPPIPATDPAAAPAAGTDPGRVQRQPDPVAMPLLPGQGATLHQLLLQHAAATPAASRDGPAPAPGSPPAAGRSSASSGGCTGPAPASVEKTRPMPQRRQLTEKLPVAGPEHTLQFRTQRQQLVHRHDQLVMGCQCRLEPPLLQRLAQRSRLQFRQFRL